MESVTKNTIFGLKMMVKSGLNSFFEIPPYGKIVIFITEFVILGTFMKLRKVVCMEESQKYFFYIDHFSPPF